MYRPKFFLIVHRSMVCGYVHTGAPHQPPGPRDFSSGDYVCVISDAALVDNQDILSLVNQTFCEKGYMYFYNIVLLYSLL